MMFFKNISSKERIFEEFMLALALGINILLLLKTKNPKICSLGVIFGVLAGGMSFHLANSKNEQNKGKILRIYSLVTLLIFTPVFAAISKGLGAAYFLSYFWQFSYLDILVKRRKKSAG